MQMCAPTMISYLDSKSPSDGYHFHPLRRIFPNHQFCLWLAIAYVQLPAHLRSVVFFRLWLDLLMCRLIAGLAYPNHSTSVEVF